MPLYEFECDTCKRRAARLMTIKNYESFDRKCTDATEISEILGDLDDGTARCSGRLHTIIQPSALHFKGSGWTPKHHA